MNDRTFHHHHAHKLDDPERERWLPSSEVLQALRVQPGAHIADVGAGTGFFARPFAAAAGATGWVAAVDLQPQMLSMLRDKPAQPGAAEISPVLASATRTSLPGGTFDLVFYGNVWHELDALEAVITEARRLLRPGGRVAILDWRTDGEQTPGPPSAIRVAPAAIIQQLHARGLEATSQLLGRYTYLVSTRA